MATPETMMAAAPTARRKPGTTALRQPAIDPHAAQSAETGTGLVLRDATMATPSLATGARQLAPSSAATPAPGAHRAMRTRAHRPAAMASWRRMRSATTATPTMMMAAVLTAKLFLAGCAQTLRAAATCHSAQKYVEMVSGHLRRAAMTTTAWPGMDVPTRAQ